MEDKITVSVQTGNLLIDKTNEDTRKDEAQKLRDTEGSPPSPVCSIAQCTIMPARAFAGDRQFKIKLNYVS